MRELTAAAVDRLETYAGHFADGFRRRDQAKWMAVYLQGLLAAGDRKTVETMAREVVPPTSVQVEDPAQALQNFVNQSPWDEKALWQIFRARAAHRLARPGVFVIEDVGFPKQGQQSVGVQRQLWSATGKKANCQVAVALSYVDAEGCVPLAIRLYLPRTWLNAPDRLEAAGVPLEARRARLRTDIALELLDAVRSEGLTAPVVAGPGYSSSDFRQALTDREMTYLLGVADDYLVVPEAATVGAAVGGASTSPWSRSVGPLPVSLGQLVSGSTSGPGFEWAPVSGEGLIDRSSNGQAALCRALVEHRAGGWPAFALTNLPTETTAQEAGRLWQARPVTTSAFRRMRDELGLDHFEGRSWRGFHHHTCLVALAYGFLISEEAREGEEDR
jgi:SRSO17 transposase